jgi:sec-independent protein translocase protein TatC
VEAFPLRAVAHDERLTVTEHLTELRTRLVLVGGVLTVAFAACLWQSRALLHVLNVPLAHLRADPVPQSGGGQLPDALARSADAFSRIGHSSSLDPQAQQAAVNAAHSLAAATRSLHAPAAHAPVTLGLGEPFSTSVTVAFAFTLLLALPLLITQAWAFVAPAIAPADRRAVKRLVIPTPALFAAGVAFAYFLVLPAAVRFLQGFNHGAFNELVRARDYYRFELTVMLALGAMFEIPILILALGRAGLLRSTTLRRHRRVAFLGLAILGGVLPSADPVTTLLETLPLFALYEASILVLRFSER